MLYLDVLKSGKPVFLSSGHFVTQRPSTHPRRRLRYFVLLVGTEGECRIAEDGEEFILRAGDYLLLLANREHYGTAPTEGKQSHYWCHFCLEEAEVFETNGGVARYGSLREPEKYDILFRQLTNAEYGAWSDSVLRQRVCDSYLTVILNEMMNDSAKGRDEKGSLVISSVKEWIKMNIDRPIVPAEVAEQFGYHPDYLTAMFRRATGKTVCSYINEVRIRRAKKWLLTTDMRVGEVARAVGFSDERYFMRVFRRIEGVTPTEYRNAHSHLHQNNE